MTEVFCILVGFFAGFMFGAFAMALACVSKRSDRDRPVARRCPDDK